MEISNFPIFKSKSEGSTSFNLNDPADRRKYFDAKAGPELKAIKQYLDEGKTFVAFLLGKKNSGKGTYSKLFIEAVGSDKIGHVSIGDIVRDAHALVESEQGQKELIEFLRQNYRGWHSPEETIDLILGRNQSSLISSELIVALIKYEISKRPRQAIFIDGFPRAMDQIGYSIFLKELIGYREDPDVMVFISLPNTVINERIKYRVICPICKTPRNLKLMVTKNAGYDDKVGEFYLKCDNPSCNEARMVPKEGDNLGIEPIRERLETDDKIMQQLLKLHGIPKIYLRNAIPVDVAKENVDDYEITPGYDFERKADSTVKVAESRWTIKDDEGCDSYSLLPPPIVVALVKQLATALNLKK
ncbi:MAG: nucleoside monophosphate kinase [Patescibacteria group bacterium]